MPQDRRRKNTEIINCLYSWGSFISPSNMECLSAFLINDCMYLHRFYINTKISFICKKTSLHNNIKPSVIDYVSKHWLFFKGIVGFLFFKDLINLFLNINFQFINIQFCTVWSKHAYKMLKFENYFLGILITTVSDPCLVTLIW